MILDNDLIAALFVSILSHALLLCVVYIRHTRSQLSDYADIPLNIEKLVTQYGATVSLRDVLNEQLNPQPPKQFKGLFACYLHGVRVLRIVALGPAFFYATTILCYVLYVGNATLSPDFDVVIAGHWVLGFGVSLHLFYFIVKVISGIPAHLQNHHPKYKNKNVGSLSLWTDFYPTVLGYKE